MERAIAVAYYVGSPLIYEINRVETQRGCPFPNSVANVGEMYSIWRGRLLSVFGKSKHPDRCGESETHFLQGL